MKTFDEKLQAELDKLPFESGVDDGMYNDGVLDGFELGARWAASHSKEPEVVSEEDIYTEAVQVANQGQFKSNFPHDWKSSHEGFRDGAAWMRSKLTNPVVTEKEIRQMAFDTYSGTSLYDDGKREGFIEGAKSIIDKRRKKFLL
jgi:hypothetical protein